MAILYSNENFPIKVVNELRALGHDVLTTLEAGKANQRIPDDEVLAFANEQGRILLTINKRDFLALDRRGQPHQGIIVCSQDEDITGQAQRIHKAIIEQRVFAGQVVRISRPHR
jgi:predicted nuclease of predicted toxin-antitoxin system